MINYKTPEQIETLRESGKRLAETLRILSEAVKPGVSTADLNTLAHRTVLDRGDSPAFLNYKPDGSIRAYPGSVCISVNEEIVHGIPNEAPRVLEEGDIVTLDMGVKHKGMITDSAITVAVGDIDAASTRLLSDTKEALYRGIDVARCGGHVGDIGAAIYDFVKGTGFSLAEGLAGHGVGQSVHEEPFVPNIGKKGEGPRLKEGMVIAIEPMLCAGTSNIKLEDDCFTFVTADGKRSAHFEHTVAILKDRTEILTES